MWKKKLENDNKLIGFVSVIFPIPVQSQAELCYS